MWIGRKASVLGWPVIALVALAVRRLAAYVSPSPRGRGLGEDSCELAVTAYLETESNPAFNIPSRFWRKVFQQ